MASNLLAMASNCSMRLTILVGVEKNTQTKKPSKFDPGNYPPSNKHGSWSGPPHEELFQGVCIYIYYIFLQIIQEILASKEIKENLGRCSSFCEEHFLVVYFLLPDAFGRPTATNAWCEPRGSNRQRLKKRASFTTVGAQTLWENTGILTALHSTVQIAQRLDPQKVYFRGPS